VLILAARVKGIAARRSAGELVALGGWLARLGPVRWAVCRMARKGRAVAACEAGLGQGVPVNAAADVRIKAALTQVRRRNRIGLILAAVLIFFGEQVVIVQLAGFVMVVAVMAAACSLCLLVNGALGHHVGWS
jgi:hypothetical protein